MRRSRHPRARRGERGFSLLEVLVAAFLLLIVFFGLAQFYMRGRRQMMYEEDRRRATAVAQARLDGIRREYSYDRLSVMDGTGLTPTDTTYTVDSRRFTVAHVVTKGVPETEATTFRITVTWRAAVGAAQVTRSHVTTTIYGRGLP
ncbi:MAG: prepilin-type N-terminal cleavage/methylation domain-containing protein [Candidatus Eisenbacteria bacterium]|uniref:Prepilin-type N-terminal cleavage/methylation domain-containing protein n=1 Tax=Eiseniibacteriota bacterium TaxID=2212470 RepID=A0A938BM59_UNCEI|nr:prepilin-type N-terminal cleavage/methylation domain-containing protein [Candidatus Eisenbacteria bacterium]